MQHILSTFPQGVLLMVPLQSIGNSHIPPSYLHLPKIKILCTGFVITLISWCNNRCNVVIHLYIGLQYSVFYIQDCILPNIDCCCDGDITQGAQPQG